VRNCQNGLQQLQHLCYIQHLSLRQMAEQVEREEDFKAKLFSLRNPHHPLSHNLSTTAFFRDDNLISSELSQ
ncbi:MAG: hypothetical protein ACRC9V_07185, partial [Aeromonas sp.]